MLLAIPSRTDYPRLVNRCSVAKNFIRILIKFHSPVLLGLLIILREINLPLTGSSLVVRSLSKWILANSFHKTSSLSRIQIIIFLLFLFIYSTKLYLRKLVRYLNHSYSRVFINLATHNLLKAIMITSLFLRSISV